MHKRRERFLGFLLARGQFAQLAYRTDFGLDQGSVSFSHLYCSNKKARRSEPCKLIALPYDMQRLLPSLRRKLPHDAPGFAQAFPISSKATPATTLTSFSRLSQAALEVYMVEFMEDRNEVQRHRTARPQTGIKPASSCPRK